MLDQATALMRVTDYKVVVMKPCAVWEKPADYEIDGLNVYRFKHYTLPSNLFPNRVSDWLSTISMLRKLRSIGVNVKDVAVCHGHVTANGIYPLAIKKQNPSCLAVVQHHGFDVMSITDGRFANFKWHKRLCIRYGTMICNAVDLNIGVSQKTLECVKQYPGVNLKREYVLYNGVDTFKFYKTSITHKGFVIGCIANFWPLKDQMTLIKAAERVVKRGMKDIYVRFIGTGITREECEHYVKEHQLQPFFSFETEVMHSELCAFYNSLDLFVLPSYYEAFGCVYAEAYACGVPFIGVKGQGISEMISDEEQDKWLIEKGDDVALSEVIINFRNDRPSQHLSRSYVIDDLVKDYINQIESLVP